MREILRPLRALLCAHNKSKGWVFAFSAEAMFPTKQQNRGFFSFSSSSVKGEGQFCFSVFYVSVCVCVYGVLFSPCVHPCVQVYTL